MIHCPNCAAPMISINPVSIQLHEFKYEAPVLVCTRCPATTDMDAEHGFVLVDFQHLRLEHLRDHFPGRLRDLKERSLRPAPYLVKGES